MYRKDLKIEEFTIRDYSKIKDVTEPPFLIEPQLESFKMFLQKEVKPSERKNRGLQKVFNEEFPVEDQHGRFRLEFVEYQVGEPKYTPEEALEKGITYGAPLRVKFRLHFMEDGKLKGTQEQWTYLGEIPLMTPTGSFIINGVERTLVMQIRKGPGVYFKEEVEKEGRRIYIGEIIPERGAWIKIQTTGNDRMVIYLDRHRKVPITTFLRALGYTDRQMVEEFHKIKKVKVKDAVGEISAEEVKINNEVFIKVGEEITKEHVDALLEKGEKEEIEVIGDKENVYIIKTLQADKTSTRIGALKKIHRVLRGTEPQNVKLAEDLLNTNYFNPDRFYLGEMGRYKMNRRFGRDIKAFCLTPQDIIDVVKGILKLSRAEILPDDEEHISNKRVRRVCELLEEQYRIALRRLVIGIKEKMTLLSPRDRKITPQSLINVKIVQSVIESFFATNPLSQFLEQTNPLSELTHKRRLSKMGPGGLTRETAGLEQRDVHYSHYGKICPIETPEGPNIGVINSLAVYARIDEMGFIRTPYRKVVKGKVTDEIVYMSPDEEDKHTIAQANAPVDENGRLKGPLVLARRKGEYPLVKVDEVDYMDVSPKQLVSLSSSLIPFLEHDDANRALMGSNMQRQAVPLLYTEPPLIATGMEKRIARDSAYVVLAKRAGTVVSVSSDEIVIKPDDAILEFDYYPLKKFLRTNQDTVINQRPIVKVGQKVKAGEVIADGPATSQGELALGKNVLVAFMPWRGYNYEDAIVISERLVKDDIYTSVTIKEFYVEVRDTKLGPEQITRELPDVPEEDLANLDEFGIVRIGAYVDEGDILVGKITPRGEKELAPEERLLRAIFAEKSTDVKNTSLRVPPGFRGVVVDVQVLSRKSDDPIFWREVERRQEKIKKKYSKMRKRLKEELNNLLKDCKDKQKEKELLGLYREKIEELKEKEQEEMIKAEEGDPLDPGVLKAVRVFVAQKRNLTLGDKLSGRHGNKGTIAKIVPEEDMPYLEDGTPVDMVLNPLGVPSRMNVGQILETHLGWAAAKLKFRAITPVFSGASIKEIKEAMKEAKIPEDGKVKLYDGRTGKPFKEKVTVGYMYMLKLIHMAEDKIHARAIGRYSLITQQPLGGKARAGGQRFGEMEVWALEAYGAAYTLQEMITVKSDDIVGRKKTYEALLKGEKLPEPGVPTSLGVLLSELRGLCLDPEIIRDREEEDGTKSS